MILQIACLVINPVTVYIFVVCIFNGMKMGPDDPGSWCLMLKAWRMYGR